VISNNQAYLIVETLDLYCHIFWFVSGDVLINAAFSVHMPGSVPLSCGAFDNSAQQGIQAMQAFIFAVNYVNNQLAPRYCFHDI
jgi:hypothetical protein